MKFREYVGEAKVKEVKEVVQTNIGQTEKEFLKQVARENPDGTKRKHNETYFGFGLDKKRLKRTFDYIKSWFIRYDVPFRAVNPYLTLYLLDNLPSKHVIIKNIKKTKRDIIYKPKGTITVMENDIAYSHGYVIVDYVPNSEYEKVLEDIFGDLYIDVIEKHCYVKLFRFDKILSNRFFEDMMYSCPKMSNLKLGNIGLLRR